MREIKFRAWHTQDLFMTHNFERWDMIVLNSVTYDVMQYTGLKDKNGKEIYEGDVVKYGHRIGEIIYCGDRFSISRKNDLDDLHFFQHDWKVEVIGNIHQNPELLVGE